MTDLVAPLPIMGWNGPIAVLDVWCGELDRRMFHEIEWPDLPRSMGQSHHSDDSVGTVDEIQILTAPDGTRYVWGRGRFAHTDDGIEAATQVADGSLRTVSVEIRDGSYTEWPIEGEDGETIGWAMEWDRAVIGAFALERNPAFAGAVIVPDTEAAGYEYVPPETPNPADGTAPDDGHRPESDPTESDETFTAEAAAVRAETVQVLRGEVDAFRQAGAGPHPFPARMFGRYDVGGPTRWNVTPDGEVTGTPIIFGKTHRANSRWTAAYNARDDLSEWLVGATHLDDGSVIRTGVIVSDGLHAPAHQKGQSPDSIRHLIESTATQLAVVNAWQDSHGIHVHGSTLPGVTAEQVTRAMAGCLSVDQRDLGDGRGFVTMGVLAVNTCGFAPDAAVVSMENGESVRRLVASALPPADCGCAAAPPGHACTCGTRAASADVETPEPEPQVDPPALVDLKALAEADAAMAAARLRAATGRRPKA